MLLLFFLAAAKRADRDKFEGFANFLRGQPANQLQISSRQGYLIAMLIGQLLNKIREENLERERKVRASCQRRV